MLVELLMAMETDQLVRDQRPQRRQQPQQSRRHAAVAVRQNATKGQRHIAPSPPASCLSAEASFLVLACVAVSLIVLPLVLPPLPPPPPLLLLVPVCLLLLLAALAAFVPSDTRTMASSYL